MLSSLKFDHDKYRNRFRNWYLVTIILCGSSLIANNHLVCWKWNNSISDIDPSTYNYPLGDRLDAYVYQIECHFLFFDGC